MQRTGNRLLDSLPAKDFAFIAPHLVPISPPLRSNFLSSEQPIENIYFITDGMASLVTQLRDGSAVGVGIVGTEGFACVAPVLGGLTTLHDVQMQFAGSAL